MRISNGIVKSSSGSSPRGNSGTPSGGVVVRLVLVIVVSVSTVEVVCIETVTVAGIVTVTV